MTELRGSYWSRVNGAYQQPVVVEPRLDQNANNARQAIWHLGRDFTLEVFPTAYGWREGKDDPIQDGRYDRGAPIELTLRGVIQPDSGSSEQDGSVRVEQNFEGERSEGQIVLHIDSHQQENLDAIEAAGPPISDIFPNGIRLVGSDQETPDENGRFTTLIVWRGRRWKPQAILELFEGGDEELATEGAVYRVLASLHRDRHHERAALPSDNPPVDFGPSIDLPDLPVDMTK